MNGLAPQTALIFEKVTKLECIKPYTLVGGTALSLQIDARQSEDLDFMSWRSTKNDRCEVDWPGIKKELETIGSVQSVDVLDVDHVEFVVDGVKVSFYANPRRSPVQNAIRYMNNLRLADPMSIGAMKMEVMLRRSKFRDYYDLYSLIESGYDIKDMVELALKYSNHQLKSKNLLAMLSRSDRFAAERNFANLNPKYRVSAKEIEQRIIKALEQSNS